MSSLLPRMKPGTSPPSVATMISTSPGSTGLLFSGGLDSTILLAHMLEDGVSVQPFYIRTNVVWENEELAAAGRVLESARSRPRPAGADVRPLVILDLPLDDLYGGHWSITGHNAPSAGTADDAVFLPGRNPLLVIKAALWCSLNNVEQLALAPLAANPFPDAGDEFFATYQAALNDSVAGQSACSPVRLIRPFATRSKQNVMLLGRELPLELTFSCIRPRGGLHCGSCNKCGERQAAFAAADLRDPTRYADNAPLLTGTPN